jgi:phosphohistidine phosphatase
MPFFLQHTRTDIMVFPMEIYLLRHGIAEDRSATGRDPDRRLTDEGRAKLRRVLERAHQAGVRPSLILSSPYRRALETAEIAAHELGYEGKIVRIPALTPDSSPQQLWEAIREHRTESALLLAGHEPLFSATVAHLLGSVHAMVHFRKGAIVRIDIETTGPTPAGVLEWMLTAKLA